MSIYVKACDFWILLGIVNIPSFGFIIIFKRSDFVDIIKYWQKFNSLKFRGGFACFLLVDGCF